MNTVSRVLWFIFICVMTLLLTAAVDPLTVTSVIFRDGTELPVIRSEDLLAPTEDDVLGYIDEYPRPLFIAHDYLAGDHIKKMLYEGYVTLKYSDGTSVKLPITGYLNLKFDSSGERQYIDDGCFYFQTCNGDGIRTVIACKIEPAKDAQDIH
jgi:hypothetical protein